MDAIQNARHEKGLTIRQAAAQAGISKTHFHLIEKGERKPSGPLAIRLAELLDLDFRDFYNHST